MPEWRSLGLGTVFLAIASSASLVYPRGIQYLLDGALADPSGAAVDRAALVLVVALAIQAVTSALRYLLFTTAGERIVARLRRDLYHAILRQEIAFFDARKTGELTSRLSSDTAVLQNGVSVNISMAVRNLATALGGVALLFYTSPRLTLVMLAVVPPIAFGAVGYGRRLRRLSREVQDALAASSDVAEESIAGIRTVRAFGAEPEEDERYGRAVESSFLLARRRIRIGAVFMAFASLLGFSAAALVLWVGGHQVLDGSMTVGELTAFLVYTLLVAISLGALTDLYTDFTKAIGAAERIFELLDRAPEMPEGGERLERVEGRVSFDDVSFAYPSRPGSNVLDQLSLDVAPGEVVAIVGPSGAGKSTLAALLTRLYDPTHGAVRLDGVPLSRLDPAWLRRQIGVVAQEPILFSTSIEENLRYGRRDAREPELVRALEAANARAFVERFPDGLRTSVGERGVQLSGGQKQRVAIARALLRDPRILVLDEATSALDAESEHLVKEALDRLMRGRTTFVIAHRLSTVRDASRVVVIDGGRLVQSGTHDALMAEDGLYRRLVERQLEAA